MKYKFPNRFDSTFILIKENSSKSVNCFTTKMFGESCTLQGLIRPMSVNFHSFCAAVCAQFTRSRRLRDDIEQRNHPQQESRRCNRCRRAGGPVRDNSKITTWLQKCQQRTSFKDSQQIISRRSNATGMSRDRF